MIDDPILDDEVEVVAKALAPAHWVEPSPSAMKQPTTQEVEVGRNYARFRARRAIRALDQYRQRDTS